MTIEGQQTEGSSETTEGQEDIKAQEGQEEEQELTPEQKKLAVLEAELAQLKAERSQAPAPAQQQGVSLSQLEGYSSEQWETIEQRTGRTKDQILNDYRAHELTSRQNALDAKSNTTEAIQDALGDNPRLLKLRGDIREYMDDVPVADKLDRAKLKRHMERAISYAKGKNMTNISTPGSGAPKGKPGTPSPKADVEEGADPDTVEGEMAAGDYTSETGLRIKLGKVDKAVWKTLRHKTREPNSVCIPKDFDKPPKFN